MIVNAVLVGLFKPMLSSGVTLVNARTVAAERGIEVVESRSTRPRNYTSLISVEARTRATASGGSKAPCSSRASPRLVHARRHRRRGAARGDDDRHVATPTSPASSATIGTILGRHGVNIANFALGRDGDSAVGVVIVDETAPIPEAVLDGTATCEGDPRSATRPGLR